MLSTICRCMPPTHFHHFPVSKIPSAITVDEVPNPKQTTRVPLYPTIASFSFAEGPVGKATFLTTHPDTWTSEILTEAVEAYFNQPAGYTSGYYC